MSCLFNLIVAKWVRSILIAKTIQLIVNFKLQSIKVFFLKFQLTKDTNSLFYSALQLSSHVTGSALAMVCLLFDYRVPAVDCGSAVAYVFACV